MSSNGRAPALPDNMRALIDSGRIPHACVIDGGHADTRTALARALAQAVLCTAAEGRPCGQCAACRKVEKGIHPDFIEVGPEAGRKTISVDVIRKMRDDAFVLPNESSCKVYLIPQAELMADYAQNALLKILEEPPQYVTFILACENASSLLPTVLSRTACFRVENEPSGTAEDADNEGEEASPEVRKLAENLALAAASGNELDLLKASAGFEKDYDLLAPALEQFKRILRDALVLAAGGTSELSGSKKAALALQKAWKTEQLLAAMQTAEQISEAVTLHANKNLTLTRLCSRLANGGTI